MNTTTNKEAQFYVDRLRYYGNLLGSNVEKALGYGEIPFDIDRDYTQWIYDFWLDAMIWFIETQKGKE